MNHQGTGLVQVGLELPRQVGEFSVGQEGSSAYRLSHDLRESEELGVKGISPMPDVDMRLDIDVDEPARA